MSQYSTFYLGERRFGLPILDVREIIHACDLTPVPLASRHVRGLINLRGQIVTILDLAVRLGLDDRLGAPETHVVILQGSQAEALAGFLVDAVGDVVEADPALMEAAPANVTATEGACVQGLLKTGTELLLLLSLDSILGARP